MNPQNKNKFNLDDLKKENPFQVPENYFDSLGSRITDRIQAGKPMEKESMFAFVRLKPILAFSGGFTGLALLIYFGFSVFINKSGYVNSQANTEIATLTEYAIVSELDEAVLIEEFAEAQADAIPADSLHLENQENIIDYLIKEDIDISTIIDEL